jgi:hypothetical protein
MKPDLVRMHFDLVLHQAGRLRDQILRDVPSDGRVRQNAIDPSPGTSLPRAEAFEWPPRGTSQKKFGPHTEGASFQA